MSEKFKFEQGRDLKAELPDEGEFIKNDLPGTDTYDDGLDDKGRLARPGSTSTESGGSYMEDMGPLDDGVHRQENDALEGMQWVDESSGSDDSDDEAARWLKENDPGDDRLAA